MRRKPTVINADASLELIIKRLKANNFFANFNLPDGENVIRFEKIEGRKYTFFYFYDNMLQDVIGRMKKIIMAIEMNYTNKPDFDSKHVNRLYMNTCYLVEEVNMNSFRHLGYRHSMYNHSYNFVYSIKEGKIGFLKPGLLSSSFHKKNNRFLNRLFNKTYDRKNNK